MTRAARRPLTATYRLQLHEGFPFAAVVDVVPYLARLGVSHLYLSPVFAARPGSTHGYDVTDPSQLNPRLGGDSAFVAMAETARRHGLGLILDIVPNHMATHESNPYWVAALTHGKDGPAGDIFDIAWEAGKIRLPILSQTCAEALAEGGISLVRDPATGLPALRAGDVMLPLRLDTVAALIAQAGFPIGTPAFAVPPPALDAFLASLPPERIAHFLAAQHYVPVHWRAAADTLTYRRFFTISDLIGVRVEDPAVFDLVHRLPLRLLADGLIDGLRVDHIDGLADPAAYAARLRAAAGPEAPIFVEKILGPAETLRPWPVQGTTGYEHITAITSAFINARGYGRLKAALRACGHLSGTFANRLFHAKATVARQALVGETEFLADGLAALAAADPAGREFGPAALRQGLVALIAGFAVYRAYVTAASADPADAALFEAALQAARRYAEPWAAAAATWIARVLLTPEAGELCRRFQQLTGPVMAKGYEDRELFRTVILGAANEVGGHIAAPAVSPAAFHAHAASGRQDLVPLATHDTKRGAATRARLAALSHHASWWLDTVARLEALAAAWRPAAGPDPADRWMLWQTAVAAWPIAADRLAAYAEKCVREAGRHGSWETPDAAYEAAVRAFCLTLIEGEAAAPCRALLETAANTIEPDAARVRIGQMILQVMLPGTPDVYQGTELPDFTLVDPDNRRPVDYAARDAVLSTSPLFDLAQPGSQMHALARLLALRANHADLFAEAPWRPEPTHPGWIAATRQAAGARVWFAVPVGPGAPPPFALPPGLTCVFTGHGLPERHTPSAAWPFIVATGPA